MEVLNGNAYLVMCSWDSIPHLSEEVKRELLESYPEYQRDARSKGIPSLGSGSVYKIAESQIVVDDFELPAHWPRCYGLDIGWRWTAAIFMALNRDTDTVYVYNEYFRAEAEPVIHAEAIKARGGWIKGAIDPAARGRSQVDGRQMLQMYTDLGLNLMDADNAVESGIYEIWTRMSSGRWKVFKSCQRWLSEFRLYRRDEKGRLVKDNDHGMDACLAPETPVITLDGVFPIRELVGKTGKVLSRDGSWLTFIGARKTIENAEVIRLRFENGTDVTCTPDHRFLTPLGWVNASDMKGLTCYNGISQCINQTRSFGELQSLSRQLSRSFKDTATTFAAGIYSAMESAFTVVFGKSGMEDISLADSMFTIGTTTAPITIQTTLNWCAGVSICRTTAKDTRGLYLKPLSMLQECGIRAKRVGNGIRSTTSGLKASFTSSRPILANAAANLSRLKLAVQTDSVPMLARAAGAEERVSTTNSARALFATSVSQRITTNAKRHVRDHAPKSNATERSVQHVSISVANIARRFLKRRHKAPDGSAPTHVQCGNGERMVLTWKNVFAWFAARLSLSLTSLHNHSARQNVLLNCVGIDAVNGRSDVYCLTVPGVHCFCLGNGAVVHNSRYAHSRLHEILSTAPAKKEKRESAYMTSSGLSTGWMG